MERDAFKQFAKLEESHWWFRGRRRLYLELLAHVLGDDARDLAVLDVGCGVGGFLGPLARFGAVRGTEIDEPSVDWCRRRGFAATFVSRSDALPVPEGSQDLICLWDVLEHTPDDALVLREMRRCLRPGGHLAISVPAYQFLYANNDRFAHHHRRYTRGHLVRRLREAGFEVRKATYVNVVLGVVIIPLVFVNRWRERLFKVPVTNRNNLTWPIPRVVNDALARVFGGEHRVLKHVSAPFGHSLMVVARRPDAAGP